MGNNKRNTRQYIFTFAQSPVLALTEISQALLLCAPAASIVQPLRSPQPKTGAATS